MELTDNLYQAPAICKVAGPNPTDGIGRALRRAFPATMDFARLLAALDLIPEVCQHGLAS
jgi:hypothetical protein